MSNKLECTGTHEQLTVYMLINEQLKTSSMHKSDKEIQGKHNHRVNIIIHYHRVNISMGKN